MHFLKSTDEERREEAAGTFRQIHLKWFLLESGCAHPCNICWGTLRYIAIELFSPSLQWVSMNKCEGDGRWVCVSADQTTLLISCQGQWQSSCETRAIILSCIEHTLTHTPRHPVSPRGLSQRGSTLFSGTVALPHLTTKEFCSLRQKVATQIHFSSI